MTKSPFGQVVCLFLGVLLTATIPGLAQVQVLVDASRDGGLWWYPQTEPFDPDAYHQGKALADYLRSQGMVVNELPRGATITAATLSGKDLVIAASEAAPYTGAELSAYDNYIAYGGKLILLADHKEYVDSDTLPLSIGLDFEGAIEGTITEFTVHPITNGMSSLPYLWGSYVSVLPAGATVLAYLSGQPVMGVMTYGAGTVFFIGDVNCMETVPQPLVDNLLVYMGFPVVPPTITVTSPNGGESWPAGSVQTITWTSAGGVGNVSIWYSTDGGWMYRPITFVTANDGSYVWYVPNAPSSTCLVMISETGGEASDQSDAAFTIAGGGSSFNSPSNRIVLPECIWAPATGGGTWISEVQVTDVTGGSQVSAYFSSGGGVRRGPIALWTNVGGERRSAKFSNLLSYLNAVDTGFTYYGKVGAVEFVTQDTSHLVQVAARTLNGNYSKTFPGLSLSELNMAFARPGGSMMIQNFTNNATYRSTCGFFNITEDPLTVEFRLYAGSGTMIGSPFSRTFVGYDFKAFSPFTEAGVPYPYYSFDNAYLVVNPTSGTGSLICFGASANNASNDPAAHMAVQYFGSYDNSPANYIVLPECIWAPATGGGTWVSEVQVTDLTGGSVVSAHFDYGGGLRRGPVAVWTNSGGAGRSAKFSNFLSTLQSADSGFTYYGRVGTVEFMTQDAAHKIQVAARTLNGDYAKTFPGLQLVDSNTADTTREMIIQNYTNNSTYRSTCGFFNPTADSVTVEFRLYSESGIMIGSAFTKTFLGYDFKAFSPFNEAGVPYPGASYDNVILSVKPTAGTGKVVCFGASANNTSNDPAAHMAVQYK